MKSVSRSGELTHAQVRELYREPPRYPFVCLNVGDHEAAIVVFGETEAQAEERARKVAAVEALLATCERMESLWDLRIQLHAAIALARGGAA